MKLEDDKITLEGYSNDIHDDIEDPSEPQVRNFAENQPSHTQVTEQSNAPHLNIDSNASVNLTVERMKPP